MSWRRSPVLLLASLSVLAWSALVSAGQALNDEILGGLRFRSIGPTRQGGRFVDFAAPLQKPHTFYAATASGGLWKTENRGQSFQPAFDNQPVFSIGDIAVDPSNPEVVWVGTGEANNSRSSYWGNGVYKTEDGGKTWAHLGLEESHHIGRLVVHPTDPGTVYVAALGHLYSENEERGLYKTEDGGRTWKEVLNFRVRGARMGCVDVVLDPRNPDVVYAATYDRLRRPWTYHIGGPGSRIHKSNDGGRTWAVLQEGLPGGHLGRIGLAVYLRNPDILYACVENVNKPGMSDEERWKEILEGRSSAGMIDGQVFRSEDGGRSWNAASPPNRSIGGAPGYYYGQIVIDPNDDRHVYVLSVGVHETTDAGKTWNSRAFAFGGDNHALWIDPADSNHMLLGYDHGLGITYDRGRTWRHPDNMPLAQFYAVGFDMSVPYRVAGGLQDNGSVLGPSTKKGSPGRQEAAAGGAGLSPALRPGPSILLEDWFSVGGGDGMFNVFDTRTNRYLYNESQFGVIQRLDLLTGETKSILYRGRDLRFNWCAPIHVSAHDSRTIYHCGNVVLRSPNRGESWEEVSPDLSTNDPAKLASGKGGDGNIQYCTITAFDESPLVSSVLWAGTDDGRVWLTRNGGKDWSELSAGIPGHPGFWVSRLTASGHDPGTAYLSFTGYRHDDFRPFLYRTSDYGRTWTSIAANLPREPVNVVREHPRNPGLLFVGTEMGVYVSIDGGRSWSQMKANLPTQPVHDLKVHPRDDELIAATHGRGLFIADISPLAELSPQVLASRLHVFTPKTKIRWLPGLTRHSSSSNYPGESEPRGLVLYFTLKD
ncbi:MAG: hypothetical protein FJY83_08535, partial [Candidatus Aminicenantes bacterium]|nr:hypothetical protein [Candidatus Aminicenantes bacterium]